MSLRHLTIRGGAEAVTLAPGSSGSGCRRRRGLTHCPAAQLLLCSLILRGPGLVLVHGPGAGEPCSTWLAQGAGRKAGHRTSTREGQQDE